MRKRVTKVVAPNKGLHLTSENRGKFDFSHISLSLGANRMHLFSQIQLASYRGREKPELYVFHEKNTPPVELSPPPIDRFPLGLAPPPGDFSPSLSDSNTDSGFEWDLFPLPVAVALLLG